MIKRIDKSLSKVKNKLKYKGQTEVHHIVAQKALRAALARITLHKVGMNVEYRENKIELKKILHKRLHNTFYYSFVNCMICPAYSVKKGPTASRKAVERRLEQIRDFLKELNAVMP